MRRTGAGWRRTGKLLAWGLLWVAIAWFFQKQAALHWDELNAQASPVRWSLMAAAGIVVCAAYLMAMMGWLTAMNALAVRPLTLAQGFGLFNVSQLTKYLPGKVWGVVLQAQLCARCGIGRATVVAVGGLTLLSLCCSALLAGAAWLAVRSPSHLQPSAWLVLGAIAGLYVAVAVGGVGMTHALLRKLSRQADIPSAGWRMPWAATLRMQAFLLASNALYGVAGWIGAVGCGMPARIDLVLPVAGATLVADLAGVIAIVVPGGIGVREGAMYVLLGATVDRRIAFLLPVAFRVCTLAADLAMGSLAIFFLKRGADTNTPLPVVADNTPPGNGQP